VGSVFSVFKLSRKTAAMDVDDDQQAILNDLLHNNPYNTLPVRSKSSSRLHRSSSSSFNATNTRVLTAVNTSKSTSNLGQSMATEHLAAGAHTKPSVLLARDLYAEKLRSMHLERQLSSSRVALRRSQQKQHDLQLSAVRKRTQHSKSVWSLLDKAARQTQRNPPLALTHAVPNLSSERDPVELLRQSIQHLEHSASYSSNTSNTSTTSDTSDTSDTTTTTAAAPSPPPSPGKARLQADLATAMEASMASSGGDGWQVMPTKQERQQQKHQRRKIKHKRRIFQHFEGGCMKCILLFMNILVLCFNV
jgi:hypothetical protein